MVYNDLDPPPFISKITPQRVYQVSGGVFESQGVFKIFLKYVVGTRFAVIRVVGKDVQIPGLANSGEEGMLRCLDVGLQV